MQILTDYQQTEIVISTFIFFFLFLIGYWIMFDLDLSDIGNVVVTTLIYFLWYLLTKIITNYLVFVNT